MNLHLPTIGIRIGSVSKGQPSGLFGGNGFADSPLMGQYLPSTRAAQSTSFHPCTTGTHAGSDAESQFPIPLGYNGLNPMTRLHFAIDTLAERYNTLRTDYSQEIRAIKTQCQLLDERTRYLDLQLETWGARAREVDESLATTSDTLVQSPAGRHVIHLLYARWSPRLVSS